MTTRKQAKAAADALLHSQRDQSERKDTRLLWYPEIQAVPFRDRATALREAKRQAWKSWSVLFVFIAYIVLFVGWVVARKLDLANNDDLAGSSILVLILGLLVHRWQTRRHLRRSVWRRAS